MLITNRLFTKQEPTKDAKLYIIYCEGKKREDHYFNYFSEISSKIRFEIVPPDHHGNNSPLGLYETANIDLNSENPKYELLENDEVWFVIDTDAWEETITQLREKCVEMNWFVVQSNPCFEVWLYYHCHDKCPDVPMTSKEWKNFVNENIRGGFNSKKHPIKIQDAILNSEKNHTENDGEPIHGCTQVFRLAKSFYPLISTHIDEVIQELGVEAINC
jgi:hypothetical protein